nr:unnamed protein product [Callosobruchus chinensis]
MVSHRTSKQLVKTGYTDSSDEIQK